MLMRFKKVKSLVITVAMALAAIVTPAFAQTNQADTMPNHSSRLRLRMAAAGEVPRPQPRPAPAAPQGM
jgi:hypothetical protein